LFPRTKCRHRSTPSRRVVDGNALLASARLLLSYLSQELSLYKCTKHSLKASHKLDMTLSTSRMVGDGSLLGQHFLQLLRLPTMFDNRPWGYIYLAQANIAVGEKLPEKYLTPVNP